MSNALHKRSNSSNIAQHSQMVASFNEIPRDPVDVTCLFVRLLKYPLVMLTGTVVDGAEDIVAVILEIFESSQREVDILASPSFLSFGGTYDTTQSAKRFMQRGGVVRRIVPISLIPLKGCTCANSIKKV
ncbi:MAG: hypothetical protein ACXV5E_03325 [Halobacteriota archaeon]